MHTNIAVPLDYSATQSLKVLFTVFSHYSIVVYSINLY